MPLKRIIGWCGRRVGWGIDRGWKVITKIFTFLALIFLILLGSFLALFGNIFLLILTGFGALCVLFLRLFAWFTRGVMTTSKTFGSHLADYTDHFFENIAEQFRKEEQALEDQMPFQVIILKK